MQPLCNSLFAAFLLGGTSISLKIATLDERIYLSMVYDLRFLTLIFASARFDNKLD